jgi:endoglucanase
MARVVEIVDWAMDNGMFVVLNSHHDNILFGLLDDGMEESQYAFARVWQQIAYTFRDYNERLMFEGLNEPRTYGSPAEWSGGTAEEHNNLNILNQIFVDVVRASGGNNAYRVLMVPTYAASAAASAQRAFVMPADTVPDRIAVSIHIYAPWEFALRTGPTGTRDTWSADNASDTRPITDPLDLVYTNFVSRGIPAMIDEMGALNRDNEEARAEWAYFYVSYARSLGMPAFWWDSGDYRVTREYEWGWVETFGLLDRATNTFVHTRVVDALMRAAG